MRGAGRGSWGECFGIVKRNLIDSVGVRTKRRNVMGMVDVKN